MKWVVILAVVALVGLVAHWQWSGRRRGGWMILASLVAAGSGFFAWREYQLESRLGEVVEELSERPGASVNCQGFLREFRLDNNLGEVAWAGKGLTATTAQLRGSVCGHLRNWMNSDKSNPSLDEVVAVHVLTHEAMHVSGITSEGATECAAVQNDERAAILLGATPGQARALAERYWAEVFPRMPGRYRANECHEDGELDMTPGDGVWP